MGLFSSGKHEPPPARDPRPKGSQKGVHQRSHQRGPFVSPSAKTRTPWLSSGKSSKGK